MLKRNLLKDRQLRGLDALVYAIFSSAEALEQEARLYHIYQLAGTNMADVQVALASTLAQALGWRTLIIYPDSLCTSIPLTLKRAAQLDPERPAVQLPTAPVPNQAAPIVFALHSQVRKEIQSGDGATATSPRLIRPDDFHVILASNPNDRQPEDYRRTWPFFTGAKQRLIWMSAKPSQVLPQGSTKFGVLTIYEPQSTIKEEMAKGCGMNSREIQGMPQAQPEGKNR